MTISEQLESSPDFYTISRSHLYWGRKPTSGLIRVFKGMQSGDVLLDPFCGGGTAIIAALGMGARVIASDLNPMAVFLSKGLIQPISLFALEQAFETVRHSVAENILGYYQVHCPKCRIEICFDYLQWNRKNSKDAPEAVKVTCEHCGYRYLRPLSEDEINRQIRLSQIQPSFWFPEKPIRAQRKSEVRFFHQLFTGRNLSALAELHHAVKNISSSRCREALHYVFTAMLYSCSQLQMFSRKSPSSSRGWTAPRFYMPPARMEKNVWKSFEVRFKNTLNCKAKLNSMLGALCITDSLERFETSEDNVCLHQADYLTFPFPKQIPVTHVFLDPPYNDDVDYMGFSEFWGSWLGMKFPIQAGWHPGTLSTEQNADRIKKLLQRVREKTRPSCHVILAYGSKRPTAWQFIEKAIQQAGYKIKETSPIFLDNPQRRKANEFSSTDRYLLLTRRIRPKTTVKKQSYLNASDIPAIERQELTLFLRTAAYLLSDSQAGKPHSAEKIREYANKLIRPPLSEKLAAIKRNDINKWSSDKQANQKAYNRLFLTFLNLILSKDDFTIVSAEKSRFDESDVPGYYDVRHLQKLKGVEKGADFVAADKKNQKIVFCFFEKGRERALRQIANRIINEDKDGFRTIHLLLFARHEDMLKYREVEYARHWPRGFFVCLGELTRRVIDVNPDSYAHLIIFAQETTADYRSEQKIRYFKAEVQSNKPVRENEDCIHYKIKFKAPELKFVVPGQFVMIDTMPLARRKRIERVPPKGIKDCVFHKRIDSLKPNSFLKRPFSIHRAFYEHFEYGYLKNVSVPPNIAPLTHTVFPSRFEIFYKVLENGVGTNELTEVKKGDIIEMLGPLGKLTDLSMLRAQGITEVHLVGGGVGMAPLVFFGQALKYYSFAVKAFIGIDRIETLLYSAPFAPTFSEDKKNAYVYVENLFSIGLASDDIYLSTEVSGEFEESFRRLPRQNCHIGFVSDQYRSHLESRKKLKGVLVMACGPAPMLCAMNTVTSQYDIPMRVLLEKRMACGIGVCMSCVCRTKKNGMEEYSRVCTDGPLFDATELNWDQT